MKVLVLHSELGVLRGGGENFTRNLFVAFSQRGHTVSAAFVADRKGRYPYSLPTGIEPIPLRGWWSRKLGQGFLSSLGRYGPFPVSFSRAWAGFQDAICWRTIAWHNDRFRSRVQQELGDTWNLFDAVYVHGDVRLAFQISSHCRTVLRLPGPVAADFKSMLRDVHAVCANGDALVQLRKSLDPSAIIELPVGLELEVFRPGEGSVRSALGWNDRHTVIGYVGRLTRLKGVDLLAQGFKKVRRTLEDARLVIIGSGEENGNLRKLLAREVDAGIAHIEGDVDHRDLAPWYRAMDLMVMPSRYENFSNAVLEALGCGVPVLASSVGGNKILEEWRAGWTFHPESVHSLGESLINILQNREEMRIRAAAGCRQVKQCCSWAATAARLEMILKKSLQENRQ